jgi:alkylation response protein AidB-like acyl-CoA dehydrogenase
VIRSQETLNLLLDSIIRFVRERLVPNEEIVAETDQIPAALLQEMKDLGLFGLCLPEEYGGLGLTMEEEVLAAMELGKTSPAFRSAIGSNNGIGSTGIVIDGTSAQKEKYLPRLASGELIGSFCLTEPEAGSDAASLRTTAVRDGDHYVLNGTKRFITNAPEAGLFTVMARTDPTAKGAGAISAFVVEAGTTGLSLEGRPYLRRDLRQLPRAGGESDRRKRGGRLQDGHESARQGPPAYRRRCDGGGRTHAGGRAALRHGAQAVRQADRRIRIDPGHAGR